MFFFLLHLYFCMFVIITSKILLPNFHGPWGKVNSHENLLPVNNYGKAGQSLRVSGKFEARFIYFCLFLRRSLSV